MTNYTVGMARRLPETNRDSLASRQETGVSNNARPSRRPRRRLASRKKHTHTQNEGKAEKENENLANIVFKQTVHGSTADGRVG